jgi:hypothetical protein
MEGTPDRLLLDEMFPAALAYRLIDRGVDCRVVGGGQGGFSLGPERLSEAALDDQRVLVTLNAVDFEAVRHQREAEGRPMPGLIYAIDDRFPRDRSFLAALTDALTRAAHEHRAAKEGGVFWLE